MRYFPQIDPLLFERLCLDFGRIKFLTQVQNHAHINLFPVFPSLLFYNFVFKISEVGLLIYRASS